MNIKHLNEELQQLLKEVNEASTNTNKENAIEALNELKWEMRQIYSGEDWQINEMNDCVSLEVRYWGHWEGDDDWARLREDDREKLYNLLQKVGNKYDVEIRNAGSEKNWLCLNILIESDDVQKEILRDFVKNYLKSD